jgi:hypothetical protein
MKLLQNARIILQHVEQALLLYEGPIIAARRCEHRVQNRNFSCQDVSNARIQRYRSVISIILFDRFTHRLSTQFSACQRLAIYSILRLSIVYNQISLEVSGYRGTMIVECADCRSYVDAKVHGGFEWLSDGTGPSSLFSLLSCSQCGTPILVRQTNVGNMADGGNGTLRSSSTQRPIYASIRTLPATSASLSMKRAIATGRARSQRLQFCAGRHLKEFAPLTV